jgi:hypothetical protein
MLEVKEDLQVIFKGVIKNICVTSQPQSTYSFGAFQPTTIVPPTSYSISFDLLRNTSPSELSHNMFDDVTDTARIFCYSYLIESSGLYKCTVDFIVTDLEKFSADIKDFTWKHYSKAFNNQLDNVLEEE